MIDELEPGVENENEQNEDGESGDSQAETGRLSQAARRERLATVAGRIGPDAVADGDRVVIEAGEPVILHLELDRDGLFTMTWWATALTDNSHHRWREAAAELLREGEDVYTSALGGGYLVELSRTTRDESDVLAWSEDSAPGDRIRELLVQFPEAVAKLPDEPVPDYLVPPEPELPPLGEAEDVIVEELDGESGTA